MLTFLNTIFLFHFLSLERKLGNAAERSPLGILEKWVLNLAQPSSVTLGKLLNLSGPISAQEI